MSKPRALLIAATAVLACAAFSAHAAETVFTATLDGAQNLPTYVGGAGPDQRPAAESGGSRGDAQTTHCREEHAAHLTRRGRGSPGRAGP